MKMDIYQLPIIVCKTGTLLRYIKQSISQPAYYRRTMGGIGMDDINEKVLREGFGIKLFSGFKTRTGFVCRTDKGMKELKKAAEEKGILFENDVKEHLIQKGFISLNRFLPALDQKPCFFYNGVYYTLENYIETQAIDDTMEENWVKGAKLLGNFHRAAKGLTSEYGRTNAGRLPILYEKRKRELQRIRKRISRQSCYNEVDLLVLYNYKRYNERIQASENLLIDSQYADYADMAIKEQTFCHNAFKPENIRLTEKGTFVLTGFGKCAYDCCMTDLAEYLRRYLKTENCCCDTIEKIIKEYNSVHDLSIGEIDIIYGMLLYPYKFLKLCNEYYNKRRVCVSEAMVQRLHKCIVANNRAEKILDQIKPITE